MPLYKKKSFKRSKKVSWINKKYSVGTIAQKALSGVMKLKQLVNVEHKIFDTYQSTGIAGTTGTLIPLSIVLQGDTYANRQGNSIKADSFEYRFRILQGQAVTGLCQSVRVIFYQDKSFDGTATVIGDILEDGAGTILNLMVAPQKHTAFGRFSILHDAVYKLEPTLAANSNMLYKDGFLAVRNHLHYSDTNPNTATNTREGQIYVWLLTDVTTDNPSISLYTRLKFVDN